MTTENPATEKTTVKTTAIHTDTTAKPTDKTTEATSTEKPTEAPTSEGPTEAPTSEGPTEDPTTITTTTKRSSTEAPAPPKPSG